MTDVEEADWPAGWLRGALELAALATLVERPMHGYALAQHLGDAGFGRVRGGVLYPVLGRLEAEGVVSASWEAGSGGPGRKVYALTDAGHRRLRAQRPQWHAFCRAMTALLDSTEAPGPTETERRQR